MGDRQAPQISRPWRIGVGAALVVVIGVFAVVVGMGVVRSTGEQVQAVAPVASQAQLTVYVHVTGAVVSPGVYSLAAGSRVVDAIAAAGGLTDTALADGINLAREVIDGEQIAVPDATSVEGVDGASGAPGDERININTATPADLEELPRIGETLADRIVQWREDNGPFRAAEDLGNVPGIGEKMLEALLPLVRVN